MTNFTLQSNVKICLELTNITFSVSSHSREVWFSDADTRYMAVLDVRVSAEAAESLCRDRHNATLADVNSDAKRTRLSSLLVREEND